MEAVQKVRDVMVTSVVTATPKTSVMHVAKLMHKKRIGSVIIVEGKKIVGILTESDFIRLVARGLGTRESLAEDFMTRDIVSCDPSITVIDALVIMRNEKVRHLPVTKRNRLVGVISLRDLIAATQFSSFYLI